MSDEIKRLLNCIAETNTQWSWPPQRCTRRATHGKYCWQHATPESHPTKRAADAGDSAVSTSSLQASVLSTSQAESAPTQRG